MSNLFYFCRPTSGDCMPVIEQECAEMLNKVQKNK